MVSNILDIDIESLLHWLKLEALKQFGKNLLFSI